MSATTLCDRMESLAAREVGQLGSASGAGGRVGPTWLSPADRDEIENASQAGDVYVWAVGGDRWPSFLMRCSGTQAQRLISTSFLPQNAHHFLIRCTGENDGSVVSVSYQEAFEVAYSTVEPQGRVPRRQPLEADINALLGVQAWAAGSVQASPMHPVVLASHGDTLLLRIMPVLAAAHEYRVQLIRVGGSMANGDDVVADTIVWRNETLDRRMAETGTEGRAYEIHVSEFGYGTIRPASMRLFLRHWERDGDPHGGEPVRQHPRTGTASG